VVLPEGKVYVHGELWNAEGTQKIKTGEKIKVKKVLGMILLVDKG